MISTSELQLEQPGSVFGANAEPIALGDLSAVEPRGSVGGLFEGVVDREQYAIGANFGASPFIILMRPAWEAR